MRYFLVAQLIVTSRREKARKISMTIDEEKGKNFILTFFMRSKGKCSRGFLFFKE